MAEHYAGLFVSHGAPTLPLEDHPARDFLRELGARLPRPRALVVMSPHWQTEGLFTKAPPQFETWHDFGGFPRELYRLQYQPPGEPVLRDRVVQLLREAVIPVELAAADRRLDHGAWVPLMLMYPEADVPLVQLSLPAHVAPDRVRAIGAALRPLTRDGVLLVGTGGAVHNLREIDFGVTGDPPEWSRAFDDWVRQRVESGDWQALDDYRSQAPHAPRAHPTDDHFLPLFFAGGAGDRATTLHTSFGHGSLSLAAYGFA
jgi:4,5-DOPA dioxygenase extradiol